MIITFISDTHTKHMEVTEDLPGGDLLIHAGDLCSAGYGWELEDFCKWYDSIENYENKVFIAGNHDWVFQRTPQKAMDIVNSYKRYKYLQDEWIGVVHPSSGKSFDLDKNGVKIWGSPWQPEFYNWAFNLPRRGKELAEKWSMIPEDTDILVTHGPSWGRVDTVYYRMHEHLGCELLSERIKVIKPKIHVCGHIHTGRGYSFDGDTHYINASVLNERYDYTQKPMTVRWEKETNELEFLN
jgi:predicted phosphodiesterase